MLLAVNCGAGSEPRTAGERVLPRMHIPRIEAQPDLAGAEEFYYVRSQSKSLTCEVFVVAIGETSAQLSLIDPDIRLMLRVRDDEIGAFEELVIKYQSRLVAVMNHLVGNNHE